MMIARTTMTNGMASDFEDEGAAARLVCQFDNLIHRLREQDILQHPG